MVSYKTMGLVAIALALLCFGVQTRSKQSYGPTIEHIEWGKITVLNHNKKMIYKDAKLWPGVSKEWDWGITNTRHNPGIQIADIREFLDAVDIVILTRGMDLVLQVPASTIEYAEKLGKKVYVGETKKMVTKYNKLVKQGKRVGGVFHSTC